MRELERKSTPLLAFVEDCCDLDVGSLTPKDLVYNRYVQWCVEQGGGFYTLARNSLFNELYGLSLSLSEHRPRADGKPGPRCIKGMSLKQTYGRLDAAFETMEQPDE